MVRTAALVLLLGAAVLLPGWLGLCRSGVLDTNGHRAAELATKRSGLVGRAAPETPPGLRESDGQKHDAPVAAIYMVGPRILCITIDDLAVHSFSEQIDWDDKGENRIEGNDGKLWEQGPWKLTRASGAAIAVRRVARDTVARGSYYADYGWAKPEYANLVDLQHNIYLTLAEPLGSKEVLAIQGPQRLQVRWEFDDRRVQTPVIQLNQVGYAPRSHRRFAYVSWWLGSGGALSLDDFPQTAEAAGRSLPLTARPDRSDAGVPIKEIDLSGLAPNQPFRIRIAGVGVSYETEISDQSVLRSFYVVTRGLFHNRFGRDTRAQYTDWVRPRDDQRPVWTTEEPNYDRKFPEDTPKVGPKKVLGGHHDAGDFDIRPMHYQVAMMLFAAYELRPEAFTDGQLTIPESGNGIPDLLDEALYSVKAWEDLQESDGGVRQGIEATRHPWGLMFADEDPMDYWTYARNTRHTLRVAGVFAQAARLVKPFDAARSRALLERARRAYGYASGHGASDADFGRMLYATGELWRASGEPEYKERFERIWRANVKWGKYPDILPKMIWSGGYDEASEAVVGEYILGYLTGPGADGAIVGQARQKLRELSAHAVRSVERLGHRHGRDPGHDPSWGEDTAAIRWVMPCAWLLRSGVEDPGCTAALSLARDYALGANPLSMSWFTGLGERSVHDPLHSDSRAFQLKDRKKPQVSRGSPMPGIPVYGPVRDLPSTPSYGYVSKLLYPTLERRPLLRRYADNAFWVNSNEFDVVHHTVLVLSMAALMSPGQMPPNDWLPAAVRKKQ